MHPTVTTYTKTLLWPSSKLTKSNNRVLDISSKAVPVASPTIFTDSVLQICSSVLLTVLHNSRRPIDVLLLQSSAVPGRMNSMVLSGQHAISQHTLTVLFSYLSPVTGGSPSHHCLAFSSLHSTHITVHFSHHVHAEPSTIYHLLGLY